MVVPSDLDLLLLVLAGAVTGLLGAVLGTGGGVFLVPLLVLAFGLPMHQAVAASIVTVAATSIAVAGIGSSKPGAANMRLGTTLELATALGALTGALTAALLAPRTLEALFAALMAPTAWLMWRGRGENDVSETADAIEPIDDLGALGAHYDDERTGASVAYRVHNLAGGLGVSFVAGNVSGMLGIGGGVFKVPALHLLCGIPMKAAAATSNFMIGVTAAASAFLYYGQGDVRPAITAATVMGVVAGSAAGMAVNRRINARFVRRLFALLLVGVAAQMAYGAWHG